MKILFLIILLPKKYRDATKSVVVRAKEGAQPWKGLNSWRVTKSTVAESRHGTQQPNCKKTLFCNQARGQSYKDILA